MCVYSIVMPGFGDPNDAEAVAVVQSVFPDREVIQVRRVLSLAIHSVLMVFTGHSLMAITAGAIKRDPSRWWQHPLYHTTVAASSSQKALTRNQDLVT